MDNQSFKILVAEDEESFRDILRTLLENEGYSVQTAANGKIARDILTLHDFDLLVSDVRMPELDGIKLLEWTKTQKPNTSVILMTGFSEILETKIASELGASEFLPKPFKQEDIMEAVKRCLDKTPKKPELGKDQDPNEYCKLSIDDFISGREIPYCIYIRLRSKFVKIAHKGEDISIDRVRDYKDKGIKHLYMRLQDFQEYLSLNLKIAKALTTNKNIPKIKKINFTKHAGEIIQEKLFVQGVNKESFDDAKDFVHCALKIVADDDDVTSVVNLLKNHADFLYAHSLGVSVYSTMLAKKARWHSLPNRFRVSLAGLLHDIGKKEIDRSVLEKKRIQLTQAERSLIETHPARSQDIIGALKSVPPDLAQIVYQHHEDINGYGYPLKLTKTRIHPIARLIAVADTFCNYVIPNPQSPDGMSAFDAINQILQFHKNRLDDEFIGYLMDSFKFKPKDIKKVA